MQKSKILALTLMGVLLGRESWAEYVPVPKEKQEVFETMDPDLRPLIDYNRNFKLGDFGEAVTLTKSFLLAADETALKQTGGGKARALSIAYLIALVAVDMEYPEKNLYQHSVDGLKKLANSLFSDYLLRKNKKFKLVDLEDCAMKFDNELCDKAFDWSDLAGFVAENRAKILKLSPRLKAQPQPNPKQGWWPRGIWG